MAKEYHQDYKSLNGSSLKTETYVKKLFVRKGKITMVKFTDEEALDIARKYDKLRIQLLNVGSENGSRKPKDYIE